MLGSPESIKSKNPWTKREVFVTIIMDDSSQQHSHFNNYIHNSFVWEFLPK